MNETIDSYNTIRFVLRYNRGDNLLGGSVLDCVGVMCRSCPSIKCEHSKQFNLRLAKDLYINCNGC